MTADWKKAIETEWTRRHGDTDNGILFPLIAQSFDAREIVAATETLLTGRLTMGDRVREYEQRFAAFVGAKYAVMVNSGSSANLLAIAVATNPARRRRLRPGDEVLIPSVCWSTSVWPVLQLGLTPVFVDVDLATLNADPSSIRAHLTPRTRGIVAVHVLGNSTAMHELLEVAHADDLILIEDTCESLGSRWNGRYLGTLGDFGTYSFYYSHHITTGEGGMVVCDDPDDYDLLVCLRAHGWSRPLSNRVEVERANPYIDPRFLFVNVGYNFRPLEVQAAFGLCQLDRLTAMNRTREENRVRLAHVLRSHPRWRGQVEFPVASPGTEPAWFGFPCLLEVGLQHHHRAYLDYLTSQGVENRPIVSGNFVRQPALKLHGLECDPLAYPQAEAVSHRGFFIGIHTERIADEMLNRLAGIMLGACGQLDAVFHLAALVPTHLVEDDPPHAIRTNVIGTANVLEAVRRSSSPSARPWIFVSSSSHVYASSERPLTEASSLAPVSLYGLTKLQAEMWATSYQSRFDVPVAVGRIFSYTSRWQLESYFMPGLARKIRSAKADAELQVPGLLGTRDFLTSGLVSTGVRALFDRRDIGVFNIGSGVATRLLDVANALRTRLDRLDVRIVPLETGTNHLNADVSKLARAGITLTCTVDDLVDEVVKGL